MDNSIFNQFQFICNNHQGHETLFFVGMKPCYICHKIENRATIEKKWNELIKCHHKKYIDSYIHRHTKLMTSLEIMDTQYVIHVAKY